MPGCALGYDATFERMLVITKYTSSRHQEIIKVWSRDIKNLSRSFHPQPVAHAGFGADVAGASDIGFDFVAEIADVDPQHMRLTGMG